MKGRKKKEYLASLLGEVKFAEKKAEKIKAKLAPSESRIKQALKDGSRELAKKYALEYEELKLEVQRAEQKIVIAKKQYELGKRKTQELQTAETTAKLAKNMEALADSLSVLDRDDDMLQKIEEEAALSEAKLELALEDAGEVGGPSLNIPDLPPATSAEDILKEFE